MLLEEMVIGMVMSLIGGLATGITLVSMGGWLYGEEGRLVGILLSMPLAFLWGFWGGWMDNK